MNSDRIILSVLVIPSIAAFAVCGVAAAPQVAAPERLAFAAASIKENKTIDAGGMTSGNERRAVHGAKLSALLSGPDVR